MTRSKFFLTQLLLTRLLREWLVCDKDSHCWSIEHMQGCLKTCFLSTSCMAVLVILTKFIYSVILLGSGTHTQGTRCLGASWPTPAAAAIPCWECLLWVPIQPDWNLINMLFLINKILTWTYSISSLTFPVLFQHLNSRELLGCCGIIAMINLQATSEAWAVLTSAF